MATFTAQFLSGGSGDGTGILVAANSSPGTTIHTVTDVEEIELYIHNSDANVVTAYIQFGEETSGKEIQLIIPARRGLTYAIPNLRLSNGLVVKIYASVANKLIVFGSANRIS